MERRLAAVLIADVVGYGRLSQTDEEGTRARFQADLREILDPRIADSRGRLVNTMGDGLLVEFRSVVDAVRCAIAVQAVKAELNARIPMEQRLAFRIGINLGDVIVEDDDIHGEGVIIAERLQNLAEPNGIAISGSAYDQVEGKLDAGYEFLGEQQVKNISKPVRVYRVMFGQLADRKPIKRAAVSRRWALAAAALLVAIVGLATWWRPWELTLERASVERMALPLPDKPSIAVLPFANMSGDPEQDYLADGISDDLITELSKVGGLFVISHNSTFALKGKIVPPQQVAENFGVRYVLEGSVQRSGERLRINAQLIDALSAGHVWADRFDGSLADVFALQDKVTRSIAEALALRLTQQEQVAIAKRETASPAAYDAFLRGWQYLRRNTAGDLAKAVPYLEDAVRLDPSYGRAQAALALLYFKGYNAGWARSFGMSPTESHRRATHYLSLARQHPSALSHQVAALILWVENQTDAALAELKEAIALDSGDSLSYAYMGGTSTTAGRPAEAIPHIRTAMRLDPHFPHDYMLWLGLAQFALEDFEAAAASFKAAAMLNQDDEYSYLALAAALGQLGRKEGATAALASYNSIRIERGDLPAAIDNVSRLRFRRHDDVTRLRDGLRLAGVPSSLYSGELAGLVRLAADENRALFLGHRLHGRSAATGEEHAATVTRDGVASLSGSWGNFSERKVRFEEDRVCFDQYCGTVFRYPRGTKDGENEYFWLSLAGSFTFSQVK